MLRKQHSQHHECPCSGRQVLYRMTADDVLGQIVDFPVVKLHNFGQNIPRHYPGLCHRELK